MTPSLVPLANLPLGPEEPAELSALRTLASAGFQVSPLGVVPADAEETFYRLNNLPSQLGALFSDLDLTDPDEDDLEERAPDAQRLVRAHFLLDEFVDLFYAGLGALPARVRVRRPYPRRPGTSNPSVKPPAGRVVTRGRPALLALKETWADDWSFGALQSRTALTQSVALGARPVLLTPATEENVSDAETVRAEKLLNACVQLLSDPALGLTGVRFL